MDDGLRASELITDNDRDWRTYDIIRLFGDQLADRILAIPIPIHQIHDLKDGAGHTAPRLLSLILLRCISQHWCGEWSLLGSGE